MHIQIAEGIRSVLIVEDEALVAMMMEDLVRELGVHDVHICGDVDAAMQLAATADIDCAVLDLMVRGGTSEPVADALADRGIPFIFTTGSDVAAFGDRHAARPSIGKPFTDDDFKLVLLDTWALRSSTPNAGAASASGLRVATVGATD